MRNYVKPVFEYVSLSVEERFALGSGGCSTYGSCPDGTSATCPSYFDSLTCNSIHATANAPGQ